MHEKSIAASVLFFLETFTQASLGDIDRCLFRTAIILKKCNYTQVMAHEKSPRDVALNFLRVPIDLALVTRQGHRPSSRYCEIAFRILFRLPASHLPRTF